MKKKFFRIIFLFSATATCIIEFALIVILHRIVATLVPFIATLMLNYAFSDIAADKISKYIAAISPDELKPDICDPEIKSVALKLERQNSLIDSQMTELKRVKAEFSAMVDNIAEGLIVANTDGDIIICNLPARNILDPHSKFNNVLELSTDEVFCSTVNSSLAGESAQGKLNIGEGIYRIYTNPLTLDEKLSGAVILLLDVTEQEAREKMRRDFTSNFSHELKTPLTTIYGTSEILAEGIVKPGDAPKFLKSIHDEAGRLIELVNNIIKLSQTDGTYFNEQKSSVDLLVLADTIVKRLEASAEPKGISLNLTGCSTTVLGVYEILEEMIYNLVDNAIKYNVPGGKVDIEISDSPQCIKVSDTGIGIPPQYTGRVFERFFRVDKSHSKTVGGTGLGLSIVKHAASFHNANVSVESIPGHGTTMTVTF